MKAAVWYGQRDVRVVDVPEPAAPRAGRVIVKVKWCGICGTDLHEYAAGPVFIPTRKPHPLTGKIAPVVLGHEFAGDVVAAGQDVTRVRPGDRVTANSFETCGTCYWCLHGQPEICQSIASLGLHLDGALAEYVDVPESSIHRLPDTVSYEVGATVEPFAVAVHAVRLGDVEPGSTVAVVGAGPIGLAVIQAAKVAGATNVIALEFAERRQQLALALGADEVLDPREDGVVRRIYASTPRTGVDVSFDCAGVPISPATAVDVLRRGGRAVIVAVHERSSDIHFNRLVFYEKQVIGSIASSDEFPAALALLDDGRLRAEPLISTKIPLSDVVAGGFDALLERKDQHVKILVSC